MNHQEIKNKIDKLPVCAEGKTAVAELLKEFGYQEPEKDLGIVTDLHEGDIFSNKDGSIKLMIFKTHDNKYFATGCNDSPYVTWEIGDRTGINYKQALIKYLNDHNFTRKFGKLIFTIEETV